ncbi:MAG TPA: hypothetical protein VF692_07750 [Pyrinomonadaceae bacterium]|jgi:hypothetical protein
MQIQTTTITTEAAQSFGANFQITTFEQTVSAFCDLCDNEANGAQTVLENRGWHLGQNEQFCPDCN